jgi:hypothetical protein
VQDVRQVQVAGRQGRFEENGVSHGRRRRKASNPRRDRVRVGSARAGRADRGAMSESDVVRTSLQAIGTDDQGAEVRLLKCENRTEDDKNPSHHDFEDSTRPCRGATTSRAVRLRRRRYELRQDMQPHSGRASSTPDAPLRRTRCARR